MNQTEFEELCQQIQRDTTDILILKGREYAGSADRLANFKRNAELSGVDPLTVLHIYMAKHWDSFSTYVRDMQAKQPRELSEPIEGRLHDLINYAVLAVALIMDAQGAMDAQGIEPLQANEVQAIWVQLEGVEDARLLTGMQAEKIERIIKSRGLDPLWAGGRIIAYRYATDHTWTPLK